MNDTENPITNLTINYRWYQQVQEIEKAQSGNMFTYSMPGPLGEWKGELYCELINNPRLIAEKILSNWLDSRSHRR